MVEQICYEVHVEDDNTTRKFTVECDQIAINGETSTLHFGNASTGLAEAIVPLSRLLFVRRVR